MIDGEGLIAFWQQLLASTGRGSCRDGIGMGLSRITHMSVKLRCELIAGLKWASEDGSAHGKAAGFGDAEVRDLLHTALRLRQGRVSTVMPQQVSGSSCRLGHPTLTSSSC